MGTFNHAIQVWLDKDKINIMSSYQINSSMSCDNIYRKFCVFSLYLKLINTMITCVSQVAAMGWGKKCIPSPPAHLPLLIVIHCLEYSDSIQNLPASRMLTLEGYDLNLGMSEHIMRQVVWNMKMLLKLGSLKFQYFNLIICIYWEILTDMYQFMVFMIPTWF